MTTIGASLYTLADWVSQFGPDTEKAVPIVEILMETNAILLDMLWAEGNLANGHKHIIRTGLPTPTWRLLNYGVQPTKGTTAPVIDTTGNLEAYSQVDKDIADMGGKTREVRAGQDAAHIEGMNQTVADCLFYGNQATDPKTFTGLSPRYNDLSAESGENIIDAGGTGSDNTSIWLVTWGERATFGIFPMGKKGGLQVQDQGEDRVVDADGGYYQAYITHFKWECGLSCADWRYNVRIANIDVPALADAGESGFDGAALELLMIDASNLLPGDGAGQSVWYCNRGISAALQKLATTKPNANLKFEDFGGKKVLMVNGFPVRRCDALLNTETRVT